MVLAMQLNTQEVKTPPRPSSTVLLLRDEQDGLEVLMQRRHEHSDVHGGAYVFPGGKLDRDDADDEMLSRLDRDAASLHAALADDGLDAAAAAAYFVAACREMFEEAGVLLATGADGALVDGEMAARATGLSRQGLTFIEVLEEMNLVLAVSALKPWSRWITPRVPLMFNKRFDVRFFLLRAPHNQLASHDNREATASLWVAPRKALELYRQGEITMAAPQLMSLAELARHASVDQAIESTLTAWPRLIDPQPFELEGARAVAYPGDARHTNAVRAMPGPTCLIFRHGRYEPPGGFDELFA